jgi:hypothetical protein
MSTNDQDDEDLEVYVPGDAEFLRLKRRRIWDPWKFLVSGEWSESPYHEGNHCFLYSVSKDSQFMRILHRSFPPTILMIGRRGAKEELGEMAARLLREINDEYGYYIEFVHHYGDLEFEV